MNITTEKGVVTLRGTAPRPLREAWEILTDTSRINEVVFGLPPVDVKGINTEKFDAQVKLAGVTVDFEEFPWAYEAPRRYSSLRVFSSGPVEKLTATCELTPAGDHTDVDYRVAIVSKSGPVGWAAEKIVVARIEEGVKKLKQILEHQSATIQSHYRYRDEAGVRAKLAPFREQLEATLVDKLFDAIATWPDENVSRLRPYALAEQWGADNKAVLSLCLHAVHAGVLAMRWDVLCPSCRAPTATAHTLHELAAKASCPFCGIDDIEVRKESNVEAVFAPVPSIRVAAPVTYCIGSPSRTPHWLSQVILDPGAVFVLQPTLSIGRFRVQSPGIATRTLIDVGENGETGVRITLEGQRGNAVPTLPDATPVVQSGQVKLTLKNEDQRARRMQLVNEGFADLTATAAHVVESDTWKRLFAGAAVAAS
jgi:hypothetical protein